MSASTLERPPEPATPSRGPRRLLFVLLAVAAVASLGGAVLLIVRMSSGGPAPIAAHPRPSLLPAATRAVPLTVTGADGRRTTCPTGAAPTVAITEAGFSPALAGGATMARGRYHIRLRGTVNNETGAAVDVRTLTASVRGRFWDAKITVPPILGPQTSAPVVIEGTYVSTETGPVRISSHFDWRWHDAELAPCGETGLVEDD